ncbi:MAG: VWA domain-containing protein [Actinomycetota bacterium]|nr:VWA domain-containing protein [Actinomycetota bacterium]
MSSLSFLEPVRLWSFGALLVVLGGYLLVQRRRGAYAARLASAELLDSILPQRTGWRRHVAASVSLLALGIFTAAFARPAYPVRVPRERATVMLAIDVSLSMQAEDVSPSRLSAAQLAAKRFVEELPPTLNLGLVSFAGTASVIVPPTTDRALAARAIDNLTLDESTAIGDAILVSLDAIANMQPDGTGELPPARIILLSDGTTTVGVEDAVASEEAKSAGVPVSTIAFGTKEGFITYDDPSTEAVEADLIPVPVGDENLEAIADATDGTYFAASSLDELEAVYEDIGSAIGYETVDREITDWFVGAGLATLLVSTALSLWWFQRLL